MLLAAGWTSAFTRPDLTHPEHGLTLGFGLGGPMLDRYSARVEAGVRVPARSEPQYARAMKVTWRALVVTGSLLLGVGLGGSTAAAKPVLPMTKSTFRQAIKLSAGEWVRLPGKNEVICDTRRIGPILGWTGSRVRGTGLPEGAIWYISLQEQSTEYRRRATLIGRKAAKLRKRAKATRSRSKRGKAGRKAKALERQEQALAKKGLSLRNEAIAAQLAGKCPPMLFDFRHASAIATVSANKSQSAKAGSRVHNAAQSADFRAGLAAWAQTGDLFDPVRSNAFSTPIKDFTIAPDNDLIYVSPSNSPMTPSGHCAVERADYETGAVTCFSDEVVPQASGGMYLPGWSDNLPRAVKFDGAGNAYFWGTSLMPPVKYFFKRVSPAGVMSDVIEPDVANNVAAGSPLESVPPFEMSPNGDVLLVVGNKLRRLTPSGLLEVVWSQPTELCGFVGDKLFLVSGQPMLERSMLTYTPGNSSLDSPAWIGPADSGATHLITDIGSMGLGCFEWELDDGAWIGYSRNGTGLFEYFPQPRRLNYEPSGEQSLSGSRSTQPSGSKLIISTTDSYNNRFMVEVYDHETNTSSVLLPPTEDRKILKTAYSARDNLVYFGGVDYSTFRNFLGTINPDTGEVKYLTSFDGDFNLIASFN